MVGWNIRKIDWVDEREDNWTCQNFCDELVTIVAEVEITLNTCPFTFVSADDLDKPLTPYLLLSSKLNNLPDPLCDNRDPAYMYGEAHSSFDLSDFITASSSFSPNFNSGLGGISIL